MFVVTCMYYIWEHQVCVCDYTGDYITRLRLSAWRTCVYVWLHVKVALKLYIRMRVIRDYMWRKGSKPVACRFLDIELEAQIGERGFKIAILQFSWCPWILPWVVKL